MFIAGFTVIFVSLGVFSGSLGKILHSVWAMRISGLFIILMGLFILGAFNKIKFLSFLSREAAFNFKNKPVGYIGSALVGIVFAMAWTPCIGPILASILFISVSMHDTAQGGYLLFVYSMGLALPFLISAVSLNLFMLAFKKVKKAVKVISVVSGIILVIMGILIFFNYLTVISAFIA
jgi:cytochrome c-type biogenesis protein